MANDQVPMTNGKLLEATDLWRSYHRGSETIHALAGLNLTLAPGEMISIVGRSGSGKTTLLKILCGLSSASKGETILPSKTQRGIIGHGIGIYDELSIKAPSPLQIVRYLSGGTQQKVVLGKWLMRWPKVLFLDEPTRGIDVGAKYEIYLLMNELAAQGKAIVMISSELPEVLGMADRILVMHDGRITGEIADAAGTTQERIMELAVA